jgi:cell division inhibitor SulA
MSDFFEVEPRAMDQLPSPRHRYAEMVEALRQGKAIAIPVTMQNAENVRRALRRAAKAKGFSVRCRTLEGLLYAERDS